MSSKQGFLLIRLGLAVLLAGCSTVEAVTEIPQAHQIAVTPAVTGITSAWLRDYIDQSGNTLIDLRPMAYPYALQAVEDHSVELLISGSTPPDGWFATPLIRDAGAVVVHSENPLEDTSLEELRALFSGVYASWNAISDSQDPVQIVVLLESDELRIAFESAISLEASPPANAIIAPNPKAVLEIIRGNPFAVGYVPLSTVDESEPGLRVLRIDGALPEASTIANHSYPIMLEVLATSPEEPVGAVRDWLVWIQRMTSEQTP
jgi:ABC-type phosphate transport system substrate-binding protein